MSCEKPLTNLGSKDCRLEMDEVKRPMFVSTSNESVTKNFITKALAATLAAWQSLFNKFHHDDDVLEKVVVTPIIYGFTDEEAEAAEFDEDGYFEKLADGDVTMIFKMNSQTAAVIKSMSVMEDRQISMYLADSSTRVWGAEDGDNIVPLEILNMSVQKFKLKTREKISQVLVKIRLKNPAQMNDLFSVDVADGNIFDDDDFYSLIDATGVTTDPALTGGTFVISEDRSGSPVTGSVFSEWIFRNTDGLEADISLASSGSITEDPSGEYDVDEAALLTSGKTYDVLISKDKFDIVVGQVVVP